jgi:GGDEF domain-containing protein
MRLAQLHDEISNLTIRTGEIEFKITCSVGATTYDPSSGARTLEALLTAADQGLYAAKSAGRNCVVFRGPASQEDEDGDPYPIWTEVR